jgi:predicted O-linked N-acetylglucosamine transferase (SPINDLY family)
LNKESPFGRGHLLHAKMLCCNWSGLNELYKEIYNDVEKNRYSATPFGYQAICDDESNLQKCAQLYSSKHFPEIKNNFFTKKISKNKKIKIGYLCGEFREHATSVLMTEVWEKHNKENFEIIAFDSGWDDKSLSRNRIIAAFDKFIDISKMSDFDAAKLIYKEQIDILINLNGFVGIGKPIVFSYRPAPIQINYLGFPGTIGSKYIDYILCDQTVVPFQSKKFYNEKIIYLPDSYQANDTKRKISEKKFLREELSLPKESFVFCCFNNNYKITPNMFDVWAVLLKKIDNSVLWLIEGNSEATENLKKEAKIRNIDGSRLIFAKRMKLEDHLARYKNADLFLDTLPYNAHTTASDSLWAGLPVLTCIGKAFPGRVAASLLRSLDLPELITYSENEYIAKAEEFAQNPEKLRLIKNKLDTNKFSKPLFNTELFCRSLESAFKIVFDKNRLGLETEDVSI